MFTTLMSIAWFGAYTKGVHDSEIVGLDSHRLLPQGPPHAGARPLSISPRERTGNLVMTSVAGAMCALVKEEIQKLRACVKFDFALGVLTHCTVTHSRQQWVSGVCL